MGFLSYSASLSVMVFVTISFWRRSKHGPNMRFTRVVSAQSACSSRATLMKSFCTSAHFR